MATFLGFGQAPVGTTRGYAITEVLMGTRDQLEAEYKDRDVILVESPGFFSQPGYAEYALMEILPETLVLRLEYSVAQGISLSEQDAADIRMLLEDAARARKKVKAALGACSDPMNKGRAFPLGVGFTTMTKRLSKRLDASVRCAGDAVQFLKQFSQFQLKAEGMLAGRGTVADRERLSARTAATRMDIVRRLVRLRPGDKLAGHTVTRLNKSRDGYVIGVSYKSREGFSEKLDIVRIYFGGSREQFKSMVDQVKAENSATAGSAVSEVP